MSHLSTNFSGNLTNDPVFRKVGDNKAVTRFRLASSRRRMTGETDQNGNPVWEDTDTLYMDVECWGQLALNTAASLSKGSPVLVEGKLVTDTWETKVGEDNFGKPVMETRSKNVMKANRIGFDMSNYQVTVRKVTGANAEPEEPLTVEQALARQAAAENGVDERRVSAEDFAASSASGGATGGGAADGAAEDATDGTEDTFAKDDNAVLVGAGEGGDKKPF